jgi:hypothetical protein
MILLASALILLGVVFAVMGQKLFRVLLPIVGLIVGMMVGFGGVQGVFGSGTISLTIAVVMALIVGAIMTLLSFAFYDLAVTLLVALMGASAFTYLGIALGLENNGFILFLLSLSGFIMGLILAANSMLSVSLVFGATAFIGVALVLAGVFLLVGEVSLDQLNETGILRSVVEVVDQSFIWLFVWIAGSIVAMNAQIKLATQEFMSDTYAYTAKKR